MPSEDLLRRMKQRGKVGGEARVQQLNDLREGRPHRQIVAAEPDTTGLPCEGCGRMYGADFLTLWQDATLCRRCLKFYRRGGGV